MALAAAAFLCSTFIKLQTAKAIEQYKAELQTRSETLKAELSIYAHEQRVGLSRLDEQRSVAIQKIYGLATRWQDTLLEICQPNPPRYPDALKTLQHCLSQAQGLVDTSEEMSVLVRDSAIFFSAESYEVISGFGMEALELSCSFRDAVLDRKDLSDSSVYESWITEFYEQADVLRERSREDFNRLRALLVKEFRVLMTAEPRLASGSDDVS